MSKTRFQPASKTPPEVQNAETKKEIDRQHVLLLANLDRKQLRGNTTMEDFRHHRQATSLTQKEKRGRYQIKTQKNELLDDLHKIRSSYTGHYDESKTPFENIQQALRAKYQTPAKNSRLPPNHYAMRKCRSNETLRSRSTSLGSASEPSSASITKNSTTPRAKTAILTNNQPKKALSSAKKSLKKGTS